MLMVQSLRWLLAAVMVPLVLAGCTGTAGRPAAGTGTADPAAGSASAVPGAHRGLSAARHVWVIELENQGYEQSFGTPSADPYLARTLPRMGALLKHYYAIGHSSAANYVAQVSGQGPSLATQADCPIWTPFPGDRIAAPYRQVLGEGCVYPAADPTLGNQLSAAGLSWATYLEDMGNDPGRASTTPAFSFVVPNLCHDGHEAPCVTGAPGGLAQADAFLAQWVPKIMVAPAYRDGGLIVVTFDEGSDAAACCGETSGVSPGHLNVPEPGKTGPGGGRIGAVLLSPLIKPGTVSTVAYNHYSLLRTIEDIFGLPHLGDAAMPQVGSFGPDVFG